MPGPCVLDPVIGNLSASVLGLLAILAAAACFADSALDQASFRNPPTQDRTRMFWRVFGPAWTNPEIDYQLELIKEAGIGGVTVFFMYPVALDNEQIHNQKYLSEEFLKTLSHAAGEARELNLRFGVAGGTGWPYGGPNVKDSDASHRVRQLVVTQTNQSRIAVLPELKRGETCLAIFYGTNKVTTNLQGNTLDLDRLDSIGATNSTSPGKSLKVFVVGPTGMRVKRPAYGAEGPVIDHYRSGPLERYLESSVAPMLSSAPGLIESVFCDSLEVYGGNWTEGFPEIFEKRRGYSITSRLPDLFDNDSKAAPDLRFDLWRTLAELTEEQFTQFLSDWSHRHGVKLEMEAYGTPPSPMTAARYIDVPTGEQYEWKGFSLSRLAASGAHLAGKNIIGAEAWTWTGIPNRLADSLSDLKLASDLHFLAGVNDLTGVDFAYSPRFVSAPGWLPYYGPAFNQNNPQWPWFRHLIDYTSRCQWLLRQGKPVADIALYLPVEDIFASGPVEQMLLGFRLRDHFVTGEKTDEFGLQTALRHRSALIHGMLMGGFNYDGIDFFAMNRIARVEQGRLIAGDGNYSVVVLPNLKGMDAAALEKIVEFCRSGGTVIATRRLPERSYGLADRDGKERVASLVASLYGSDPDLTRPWSRSFGSGRVAFVPDESKDLAAILSECHPDVRFDTPQPNVGFVHRRDGNRDLYFLANVSENTCVFKAGFHPLSNKASLWNPIAGETCSVEPVKSSDGSLVLPLELPPRGSIFVVFDTATSGLARPDLHFQKEDLKLSWEISFAGTNAPPARPVPELVSWTTWPDAKYFSGSATYTGQFQWNRAIPRQAWLHLSQVNVVGEVRINGQSAGPVWNPPFEVEITRHLKPGTNTLSITVANLPLNRFLGTPDEDLKPLRAVYGNRFPDPEEKRLLSEPLPSGLLGPVGIRYSVE